jgi:tRNA pseudouridine55 synthase
MYSALKVDGQPLYKLARQGKEVERKSRPVTIRSAELNRFSPGEAATADIDVVCSKGTYIRTLSEDLATSLDLPGHMSALRRTATGPFDLGQAVTLETLIAVAETEGESSLDRFLIDPELAVDHLARVEVSHSAAFYLKQGQAVLVRNAPLSGIVRIAEADGPFLGVGVILDDGRVAPKRLFVDSH